MQLTQYNSFAIAAYCPHYYAPSSIEQLNDIFPLPDQSFYILGEGSNTLFVESTTPTIIQPNFTGISVKEAAHQVELTVKSGENWHQLVEFCLARGYHGIENLALIPGSVGAAPVQNIGAYGVELADVVKSVQWYEFAKQKLHTLSKAQCQFAYRDSIFKHQYYGKGLIVSVTLTLSKQWGPNLSYQGLEALGLQATAEQVFNQVVQLRQAKLPDPKILPNAGSFFKNPIVELDVFHKLQQVYPNMPSYPQEDNQVKLAAGWLIEQSGLKGYRQGEAGVHKQQALVLVNHGQATGKDIYQLAQYVQQQVAQKFDIWLEPEVRLLDDKGLMPLVHKEKQR
ncbi:UDP-N-acetylmuramate dehydrogenase [Thalassotalea sp. G2M2-11]|uniref:UDP-N-acetylmuramate dehydrogenase n=1 Tax=Thalassotalea sp. G2M2-11 TaxID=2787627 RepID=UPI001F498725|nr:UDP-N-acetylmuramate dehydrogenase [Thalassotalea sp. G2M2-11]